MTNARGADIPRKGSQEVKDHMRDTLDAVEFRGQHILITRKGRDSAVLVPLEWRERAAAALNREAAQ